MTKTPIPSAALGADRVQKAKSLLAARGITQPTEAQMASVYAQLERELGQQARPSEPDDAAGKRAAHRLLNAFAEKVLAESGLAIETANEDQYIAAVDEAQRRLNLNYGAL